MGPIRPRRRYFPVQRYRRCAGAVAHERPDPIPLHADLLGLNAVTSERRSDPYERDMPIDRGGLVQQFVYLLEAWSFTAL